MALATRPITSAPGPDGVCHRALAHAAPWLVPVLKEVAGEAKRDPSSIPANFNDALLALLPKGGGGDRQ